MKVSEISDLSSTKLYYYERHEPPKFVFEKPRRQPPSEAKQITIVGEASSPSPSPSSSKSAPPPPSTSVINAPPAPALPDWARSTPAAKPKGGWKRLNIPKKKKEDEKPKKKAVGMGDLMSELRDKIGGGKMKMKKVEPKVVGKLKKHSGKKKGGFTDIMDELSHTLAKLRGDILDDSPVKAVSGTDGAGDDILTGKRTDDDDATIGSEMDILAVQPEDNDERKRRKSFTLGVQRLLLKETDDAEERRHSVTSATGGDSDGDDQSSKVDKNKFSKYAR